ncbi:hypothetical protein [Halosimplex sp. TS25]|uniref:hypothetical protein n=1 Tax=Halosimplex rarum TaxID=3396619 RepID=UPI0039EA1A75
MGALIEPAVLARAKDFLLPSDAERGFAVVDAQFKAATWGNQSIGADTRSQLEPINSLQMASGNPDAILAPPKPGTYRGAIEDTVTALPLAIIEAKGETEHNSQKTTRIAITQAHGHLGEANLGFAAVPTGYISDEDRSLARELNIGLLAIDEGHVDVVEKSRLVGTETTPTAETVRFHAQLGGTAVESLKKNHPKNALGYALAIQHPGDTADVFTDYVIQSVDDARLDAMAIGLVSKSLGGPQLTPAGREAVRTIRFHHGGLEPALDCIDALTGSGRRFIDECPVMGTVVRQSLLSYPPTQVLVNTLDDLAQDGVTEPSLATVASAVAAERPNFTLDLFISTRSEYRDRVLSDKDGEVIDTSALTEGEVYSTHTTFQYKAMLYHAGILTERGTGTKSELDPKSDIWALETSIV